MGNRVLEGYKVLDLTNEYGAYTGRMMAAMGATVFKVEPPEGDRTRYIGPFAGGEANGENSCFHAYYNAGKLSVTLDYTKPEGKEIFKKLIPEVDVILESFKPGTMDALGLGYEDLKKINPKLVYCAITAFGQTGYYSKWNASSEIIPFAIAGPMFSNGMPNGTPLQLGYNILSTGADVYAVAAVLGALFGREKSGKGDYIDQAIYDIAGTIHGMTLGGAQLKPNPVIAQRTGPQHGMKPASYYKCKDGYAYLAAPGKWKECVEWMKEDGIDVNGMDDESYFSGGGLNKKLIAQADELDALVEKLFSKYTMKELQLKGIEKGVPIGPSETTATAPENPQYEARGFFKKVDTDTMGSYIVPGAAIGFTESPMCTKMAAPKLGYSNETLYSVFGYTGEKLEELKSKGII